MNLNKIIQEWFYRLDKGYATPPYNETELKILDEVLIEFNVSSNYRSTIQNLSSIEERSDEEIDDAPPTTDDSADHYVQNSDFRDLLDSFEKFKEILIYSWKLLSLEQRQELVKLGVYPQNTALNFVK